jgi:hypothetical protein
MLFERSGERQSSSPDATVTSAERTSIIPQS